MKILSIFLLRNNFTSARNFIPKSFARTRMTWVKYNGNIPKNVVIGGWGEYETVYIGRSEHEGNVLPTKVVNWHTHQKINAYIALNGRRVEVHNYDILTGNEYFWVPSGNGEILGWAFPGGRIKDTNETLYIGRTFLGEHMSMGKVQPSSKGLHILYGHREKFFKIYDILLSPPEMSRHDKIHNRVSEREKNVHDEKKKSESLSQHE